MAADGRVVFEIDGDNRNVKQALNDTTAAIEKEGKKWDQSAAQTSGGIEDKFLGMFTKISAAAVAVKVGKAILDWGKAAVQAASDLEEVQNVVDTTFGESAAQIEKWAKAAGQQFGLTETQAKKFTSTLGAMAKSAGLAGPEIVDMSTDLAGLAADMSSFYNLDFETAFQKIRSGISGETEPLKQLGINMSVANLEAYALSKGITKAFNTMSQGEQMMLRYQYLMQATADAQGDFAKTSDSYANGLRILETNMETLKTNVGTYLLPLINNVVAGINDMIGALTQETPTTVLDDFAAIDLKTEEKLAQIQQTADEARAMTAVLEEIAGKKITSESLTTFVSNLSTKLTGLDSAMEKAKTGDYAGTITELAEALSTQIGGSADQWVTLLSAIGSELPDAVDATLTDDGQTAAFLSAAAAAADDLGGEYPALWKSMLEVLGDNAGAAITALANGATSAAVLGEMAKGFNTLSPTTSANKWESLLKALSENGNFDFAGKGTSIEELAKALNGESPEMDKITAWQTMFDVLSTDPTSLQLLTGLDAGQTSAWLTTMAEAADDLTNDDANAWDKMFGVLRGGLPNLTNATEWEKILNALQGAGAVTFGNITGGIEGLAEALEGNDPNTSKAEAWKTLLGALASDMTSLQNLTLDDAASTAEWLKTMAEGVNEIEPGDAEGWAALFEKFKDGLPGLENKDDWISILQELQKTGNVKFGNIGTSLVNFASALNGTDPNTDRAQAWQQLLDALASDAETLQALTGEDAAGAAAWLEEMAAAANNLNPDSAEGWDALLGKLLEGLPGLKENPDYSGLFSGLGAATSDAEEYLKALGVETDGIADKQAVWLLTCKQLVKTIPALSSVINTETGEVKGGVEALKEAIQAWEDGQKKIALTQAVNQKESALSSKFSELPGLELDMAVAEKRVRQNRAKIDALLEKYGLTPGDYWDKWDMNAATTAEMAADFQAFNALIDEEYRLEQAANDATNEYQRQKEAYDEAKEAIEEYRATVAEMPGTVEEAAQAMTELEKAASGDTAAFDALSEALTAATSALDEVSQYYDKVKQESESSIKSVVKGFETIETPAQKAWNTARNLTDEFKDLSDAELDMRLKSEGTVPSIHSMSEALQSQLDYLEAYNVYLAQAKANGVSDDILATLADGSVESFDYLKVLANAGEGDVKKLNDQWAAVAEARETLTQSMTDTKLNADDEFQSLVDAAQAAAEGLNVYHTAENAMEQTVQGIADGIAASIDKVQTQVDALNLVLGGIDTGLADWLGPRFKIDGSHALGLDYVPFDNYLAQLHEGESILTAEEARVWRNFKYGGNSSANTIDYEALGGTMRDNIKPGGNVYLDGRVVGSVISAQQGNSLRALERSGWQQ